MLIELLIASVLHWRWATHEKFACVQTELILHSLALWTVNRIGWLHFTSTAVVRASLVNAPPVVTAFVTK